MTLLATLAVAVGAMLGFRYKIFALLPASSICLVVAVANSIAMHRDISMTVLSIFVSVICLQFGYLAAGIRLSSSTKRGMAPPNRRPSVIESRTTAH
jgi:predicted Na+-dependent transporter